MNELVNEVMSRSREACSVSAEAYDLLMALRAEADKSGYVEAVNDILNNVIESHEDTGGEASIYSGYSGRGMYGKKCYGISCNDPTDIIERAAQAGIVGAKMDSLGRGTIVYWPDLRYEDTEE